MPRSSAAPAFAGALTAAAILSFAAAAQADPIPKAQAVADCQGAAPSAAQYETPYGETPAEHAAKLVAFTWNCDAMVLGRTKEAFDKYVSKDFCDHTHLLTQGHKDCANYDETLESFFRMAKQFGSGPAIEVPVMASVNGEMVTMYGEGIDIFRIHDGKLTDHWDASPPAQITLKAHAPGFAAWAMGDRTTPPPVATGGEGGGITVNEELLTAVNVGPLTPYAETAKEMANKRVVFVRNYLSMIQGKSREAIQTYVSPNFCDHSHTITRGKKECATRDELLASPMGHHNAAKLGDVIEMPYMATVDGEMVTMYGAGVDIFRVHDGLITDHWDASPPRGMTAHAHPINVVERMIKVLAGEAPAVSPAGPNAPGGGAPPSQSTGG